MMHLLHTKCHKVGVATYMWEYSAPSPLKSYLHSCTYITMYANDLLLHREISCPEDYFKLQQDQGRIQGGVMGGR